MTKQKQYIIIGVAVAAVIAIAAVVWIQIDRNRDSQAQKDKTAYEKIIVDSQTLITNNKYDAAIYALNAYIKKNPPKDYQQRAYAQLGAAYANKGNYEEARKNYLKAQELAGKPQLNTVLGIAYMSQALNDKEMAIEYFNKAIEFKEASDDPFADEEIASYKAMIKQIEEGQGEQQ